MTLLKPSLPNGLKLFGAALAIFCLCWGLPRACAENSSVNSFSDPRLQPILTQTGSPTAIGNYNLGCLLNAKPVTNLAKWENLVPSRHAYFGTQDMQTFLEKLSDDNQGKLGVGDIAQPAGGPLNSGHLSHETGLDADIRYEVLPYGSFMTAEQRQNHPAVVVAVHQANESRAGGKMELESHMIDGVWTPQLTQLLRTAAEYPGTQRIFVSPPVKMFLCQEEFKKSHHYPEWLKKLRPFYGHDDHFHVRLSCPKDTPSCEPQKPIEVDGDDLTKVGCSGSSLKWWTNTEDIQSKDSSFLGEAIYNHEHPDNSKPTKTRAMLDRLDKLSPQCKAVQQLAIDQLKGLSSTAAPAP